MGLMSMCPACGSDWCFGAECVKDSMTHKFITKLRSLRARNDGHIVMIRLDEIDNLIQELQENLNV